MQLPMLSVSTAIRRSVNIWWWQAAESNNSCAPVRKHNRAEARGVNKTLGKEWIVCTHDFTPAFKVCDYARGLDYEVSEQVVGREQRCQSSPREHLRGWGFFFVCYLFSSVIKWFLDGLQVARRRKFQSIHRVRAQTTYCMSHFLTF